jgi:hypothetical protein
MTLDPRDALRVALAPRSIACLSRFGSAVDARVARGAARARDENAAR